MVRVVRAVVIVAALSATAAAQPVADGIACDPRISAAVAADARRAWKWNVFWGVTFGVAAVGAAGIGALAPDDAISDDTRAGLYVTAAKATLGALSRVVLPLRIHSDPTCASRPARAQLAAAARKEKRNILLNAFGGLAVNTAGLLYLGLDRGAWKTGWIGFGLGTAVGLVSSYTAPRRSWLLQRRIDREVVVAPVVTGDFAGFALAGTW